jgi:NADP-dependent 3-hydroxy acid dehydrogenase YdfG
MDDIALVTGAAGALGSEVARTLQARGYGLALVDVAGARDRLEQLAASIGGACVVAGDLGTQALWAEAMPRIERELGAPPAIAALVAGGWRGGCTRRAATRCGER